MNIKLLLSMIISTLLITGFYVIVLISISQSKAVLPKSEWSYLLLKLNLLTVVINGLFYILLGILLDVTK